MTLAATDTANPLRKAWWRVLAALAAMVGPVTLASLLTAVGAPILLFWVALAVSLAMLPVVWIRLASRPAAIAGILIGWFAVHKLIVALLAPHVPPETTVWYKNYKEAMYPSLLVTLAALGVWTLRTESDRVGKVIRAVRSRAVLADGLAVALIGLVVIYFVIGLLTATSDVGQQLVYARRFSSLPILYLAGRLLFLESAPQFRLGVATFLAVATGVSLFGLAERLILGDEFWTGVVHIGTYQNTLSEGGFASERARLVDGMPANWIAYFGDVGIRRLVSSFVEPTTLAIFLALALGLTILAIPEWRRRHPVPWIMLVSVIGLALILSFGKAGWVIAAGIMVGRLVRISRTSMPWILGAGVLLGLFTALLITQMRIEPLVPLANNVSLHLQGLASGLTHLFEQPLGTGLGTTGFWGDQRTVGTDSTVGAIASQVGLLGAVLWLAWLGAVGRAVLPSDASHERGAPVRRALGSGLLALMLVSVVSESTSGLLAGTPYLLLGGWLVSVVTEAGEEERV